MARAQPQTSTGSILVNATSEDDVDFFKEDDYTIHSADLTIQDGLPKIAKDVQNFVDKFNKLGDKNRPIEDLQVVIYIHGYSLMLPRPFGWGNRASHHREVTQEDSKTRSEELDEVFEFVTDKEKQKTGATEETKRLVLFCNVTWPSEGYLTEKDTNHSKNTASLIPVPYVYQLVVCLASHGVKNICFLAHSMGNYVLIHTIHKLLDEIENKQNEEISIDTIDFTKMQFVSCASAVDVKLMRQTLKRLGVFGMKNYDLHKAAGDPKPVYLNWTSYYHDNDWVLQKWQDFDLMQSFKYIKDNLKLGNIAIKDENDKYQINKDWIDDKLNQNKKYASRRVGSVNINDIATIKFTKFLEKPPGWQTMQQSFEISDKLLMVHSIDCSKMDMSELEDAVEELLNHWYLDCRKMKEDMRQLIIEKKTKPNKRNEVEYSYSIL